jgi:hypothetical protein
MACLKYNNQISHRKVKLVIKKEMGEGHIGNGKRSGMWSKKGLMILPGCPCFCS